MEEFQQWPKIFQFVIQYAALLFSLSIHESAHALSAYLLGDETSRNEGRISVNPIDHIDIFGTVIFPIIAFLTTIPVIGWAKPVMVNPLNLRDPKRDDILISASGPASNLIAAVIFVAFLPVIKSLNLNAPWLLALIGYIILINVILAFFNLIPIPPLDGSGIARGFMSDNLAEKYDTLQGFGFILLYALLFLGVLDIAFGIAMKFLMAIYLMMGSV